MIPVAMKNLYVGDALLILHIIVEIAEIFLIDIHVHTIKKMKLVPRGNRHDQLQPKKRRLEGTCILT